MIKLIDFNITSTKFEERPMTFESMEEFEITLKLEKENTKFLKVIKFKKGFQTYGYSIPKKLSFLAPRIMQSSYTFQDREYNAPILALQALYDLGEASGFTETEARNIFSQMVEFSYSPKIRVFIARGFTLIFDCKTLQWGKDVLGNSPLLSID